MNQDDAGCPVQVVTIGGTPFDVDLLLDTAGKHAAIAAAEGGTATTTAAIIKMCPSFKNVSFYGNGCQADPPNSCPHIHLASQLAVDAIGQVRPPARIGYRLFYQHDNLHIGFHKKEVSCNNHLSALSKCLSGMSVAEVGNVPLVEPPQGTPPLLPPPTAAAPTITTISSDEVVIAIDPIRTRLRDDAFSCKIMSIPQKGDDNGGCITTATKQVLSFTSYTPNFVDQGIAMGRLNPATLSRASRLFMPHYFHGKPVKLWGDWVQRISLSTEFATSAIAATKYFDFVTTTTNGNDDDTLVRVTGESDVQPEKPLRIVNVKVSHTMDYDASHDIISRSMAGPTIPSSITDCEYFKLPCGSMERTLVLAGAVASCWCLKAPGDTNEDDGEGVTPHQGPANVSASFNADCSYGVRLSISYRGYSERASEPFGHNVVSAASDLIGKVCAEKIDLTQAACTVRKIRHPTEDQLRQLRTIAGMTKDADRTAAYEDVIARLTKLGYSAGDVERSIGCDLSEEHARMSDYPTDNWLRCTKPLRRFISCYHQFLVLNAIDPDSPAAVVRKALLRTLPPFEELLLQWTTKRDSTCVTSFKCTYAIKRTMGSIAPHVVVPVKAVVVGSDDSQSSSPASTHLQPQDGGVTMLRVFIPQATPPSCDKKGAWDAAPAPVVINIPVSCARDKDGRPTNAFDMTTCGVGKAVMLVMSLGTLANLTSGMVVTNERVSLVPEVPLSVLPPVFGRSAVTQLPPQSPPAAVTSAVVSSSSASSTDTSVVVSETPSPSSRPRMTSSSPLPPLVAVPQSYNWEC